MSWSYSGDPASSDLDELRFILEDTNPKVQLLSNEELNYLIGFWVPRYDSLIYAASVACGNISRKFVTAVSVSADGVTVDLSKISDKYAAKAEELLHLYEKAQVGGEIDISYLFEGAQLDSGIKPLTFSIGMHDNIAAGSQEYGGEIPPIHWPEVP